MGNTLYLQCENGISGDMVVGALLDLGASEERLRTALASLPVDGYQVAITRKTVNAIDVCDFDVQLDATHENHDHDMAYLFGDLDKPGADHHHEHEHHHHHGQLDATHENHHHEHHGEGSGDAVSAHTHAHEHDGVAAHHHHEHRHLADIYRIIDAGQLTPRACELAKKIFSIVAEAESKAHGVPLEEVHFHEVGAVDSIVDVVAAAVCLDDLNITQAIVSPLAEGHGRVRTQHGVLSIPVPAVANIVMAYGLTLARHEAEGEFVTPTGAAIAAAIRTADELPESYTIKAMGTGSGKRAYEPVSTLRAMLIEPRSIAPKAENPNARAATADGVAAAAMAAEVAHNPYQSVSCADAGSSQPILVGESTGPVRLGSMEDATATDACGNGPLWKLETEVDDCTGEALGYALDQLFAVGVREAHYVPVFMKKNRPAYQVEVLCTEDLIHEAERVLFETMTTIGIRRYPVERTALARREVKVQTEYGAALAKVVTLPDGRERVYPEHDSVAALSQAAGVPYQEAYRAVLAAAE